MPPGLIDLSVDVSALEAEAGLSPWVEYQRIAAARPADVESMAAGFRNAGGKFSTAWDRSVSTGELIAASATGGGAPIRDTSMHRARLPAGFDGAAERLTAAATRIDAVARDLRDAMHVTSTEVEALTTRIETTVAAWSSRVESAKTLPGGLIPLEEIPLLQGEHAAVKDRIRTDIRDTGTVVSGRIQAYEAVINEALKGLADQGVVDVADLGAPAPPAAEYQGEVGPAALGTPIHAGYAADPVNTAVGNFVETESDLPFQELLAGLSVHRTYNSRAADEPGPFGSRWASWATASLRETDTAAELTSPDGQAFTVPKDGTGFARVPDLAARVSRRSDGLTLTWSDGRRWDFGADGRPVRTTSGPGTAVTFEYAEDGRLLRMLHERGRRVVWEWGGSRVVAVSGSDGRRVIFGYDARGRLTSATGPAGPRRYGLDEAGYVASVTDADGVVELRNTYDAAGRVLSQVSPFGRTTTFAYARDRTVVAGEGAGPETAYEHDSAGRLVAATDGHGHTQRTTYDDWGNPTEIVERGGAVVRQMWDERSRLVRRVLPSGAELVATYDDADRVVATSVDGAETRMRYDGAERIPSEVTAPDGAVTRMQVTRGLVESVTDPDGVTVRFTHDEHGHLLAAVDAVGGTARVERDPAGRPVATVSPAGRRTELTWDSRDLLVRRTDPDGGRWWYEYTPAGRRTTVTGPDDVRTEIRYGGHGEAVETVDGLGAVTAQTYDVFGNPAAVTVPDGTTWSYAYDALSRVTALTDPAGGTWLREYDRDGRLAGATDPTGARDRAAYDASGALIELDDGATATAFEHDRLGRVTARVRVDGTAARTTYDDCGRVLAVTAPDGAVTTYAYSAAGRLVSRTSPAGRVQRWEYDDRGLVSAYVDGAGQRWEQRYDADGLLTERISPTGLVETFTRDTMGRVLRHRVPGVGTTEYGYDVMGRVSAMTDRQGRRTFSRDAAGRVVAVTDALGGTTRHAWDAVGRLVETVDPLGGRTRFGYDELGRVTAVADPLGRVTRHTYDAAGRLRETVTPDGTVRERRYDEAGRHIATLVGELRWEVAHDELGRPVHLTATGRDPVVLTWDAGDRLVRRTSGQRTLDLGYDADGLRTSLTHLDGSVTRYHRDGAGRLGSWKHPAVGRVTVQRDPDGRVLGTDGVGVRVRRAYSDGWLVTHTTTASGTQAAPTRTTTLVRDEHGRVVAEDTDGRTRTFGYDAAGQLIRATGGADENWRFTYDAGGRLLREFGPDGDRAFSYDAAGQPREISGPGAERRIVHCDALGRRTSEETDDVTREYHRDAFGDLVGISTGARETELGYDAEGELVRVNGVELAWDPTEPAAPLIAAGASTLHGHGWAISGPSGARPMAPDWQGSVGARGADPWGGAAVAPGLGFRGELALDGLVWLRNRAYDPGTRSFLTPDPLDAVPGTAYSSWPYHFAGNDPVNALDPLGLRPMTDADLAAQQDAGGGGLWGAVSGWWGENWEYAAAGGMAALGVGLMFTGVGGVAGAALMAGSGALLSGATSVAGQRHANGAGSVDWSRVRGDALMGMVPGGGTSAAAGIAGRGAGRALRGTGSPPPNLSPPGAGRRGAFRQAKRDLEIPMSEHPTAVTPNFDRLGRLQPGRVYEFPLRPGDKPNKLVDPDDPDEVPSLKIREDSGGHVYRDDPTQNRGPHFNGPEETHYDY